jgi:L-asparagine oxygenase
MDLTLTPSEIETLLTLSNNITASPSTEQELFCSQAKEQTKNLPQRIKSALESFDSFLLIKTIPIHETPETPKGNKYKIGETTILAKVQAILVSAIGDMIAYEAEGNGHLFQDVVPLKSMETEQTSLGSNTELEIHTEQAFSNLKPDILSLACLRGDPNACTHIFPVAEIIKNTTPQEQQILREPLWYTEVDLSFKLNNNDFIEGDTRGPMPIISGPENNPKLVFDQDLMSSPDPRAKEMIKKIINLYYQYKLRHNLTPGEIILIDNNRAVHGRSAFSPKYDGKDRFLIRAFATFDLKKSEYARKQRTVSAIYS